MKTCVQIRSMIRVNAYWFCIVMLMISFFYFTLDYDYEFDSGMIKINDKDECIDYN